MEELIKHIEWTISNIQHGPYHLKTKSFARKVAFEYVSDHFPLITWNGDFFKFDVFQVMQNEFDIKIIINDSFVNQMKLHYPEYAI